MRRQPVTRFIPVLLGLGVLAVTVSAHAAPKPDRDPPRRPHKLIWLDHDLTPQQVDEKLKEHGVPSDVRDQVKEIHQQQHDATDLPPADTVGIQATYTFPLNCQRAQDGWVTYRVGYGSGTDNWHYLKNGVPYSSWYGFFQTDPRRVAYSEFPTLADETITVHQFTTGINGYYTGGGCFTM